MIRHADAHWEGSLKEGQGHLRVETLALDGPYNSRSRFGEGRETNPEELLGAALAGCFSMALSAMLTGAGHVPKSIDTKAAVHLIPVTGGWSISEIELETVVDVPDLNEASFAQHANNAKANCPVSKALTGVKIELKAKLAEAGQLQEQG
ncbi:MAG TPA: OsmC family peroxiredoxin [Bryobacteraceae bacterium]|nr:OsmC family peroxiredoxin [Bryobacteraceae bacterium]